MFASSNHTKRIMEIEKVIRIIALFLVVVLFVIKVATHLLFPEASHMSHLPIAVILSISLWNLWRDTNKEKRQQSNK